MSAAIHATLGATTLDATTGYVLLVVFVATLIRSTLGSRCRRWATAAS